MILNRIFGVACIASLASCGLTSANSESEGLNPGVPVYDLKAEVLNTPKSSVVKSSVLEVEFGLSGQDTSNPNLVFQTYTCKVKGQTTFTPCSGNPFSLSGLKDGEKYEVGVRAQFQDKSSGQIIISNESTIDFSVNLSGGDAGMNPLARGRALSNKLQVGAEFAVEVPMNMHLTEYSTSKTTGVLNTYRILPESDPFYLGNFACNRSFDRVIASYSPAGDALSYCHSTPPRSVYKVENEFRLANNHIEIATDATKATTTNYERIAVAVYDQDYEFMNQRSRFYRSCSRSQIKSMPVPMINDFFTGRNPDEVTFHYCDVMMPGITGQSETWRIGAFTDRPFDWTRDRAPHELPTVEISYMKLASSDIFLPEYFAKHVQTRMLSILTRIKL